MSQILVVDDHPDMREILTGMLQLYGHTVQTCDSGEAALRVLASDLPDGMIIDDQMSGLPGLDVVRRIRQDQRLKKLFVVVWSADRSCRERAFLEAADEFWVKGSESILESIEQLSKKLSAHDVQRTGASA
jgi:CheY-like chemotaxis protein